MEARKRNSAWCVGTEAKPIPEALAQYGTFDMDEKLVKMLFAKIIQDHAALWGILQGLL